VIVRISSPAVVRESDGATLLLVAGAVVDGELPASLRVIEPSAEEQPWSG
jgi:hypothetical protein